MKIIIPYIIGGRIMIVLEQLKKDHDNLRGRIEPYFQVSISSEFKKKKKKENHFFITSQVFIFNL